MCTSFDVILAPLNARRGFRMYLKPDESVEDAKKIKARAPPEIRPALYGCLTDMIWDDEILHVIKTRNNLKSMAEDLIDEATNAAP